MRIVKSVSAILAICATMLGVGIVWSRRTAGGAADRRLNTRGLRRGRR